MITLFVVTHLAAVALGIAVAKVVPAGGRSLPIKTAVPVAPPTPAPADLINQIKSYLSAEALKAEQAVFLNKLKGLP
jgi:hypothetical protein